MRQLPLIILFIIAVFFVTGIVIGSRMQLAPAIAISDKPTYSNSTLSQTSTSEIGSDPTIELTIVPAVEPLPNAPENTQPHAAQSGGLGLSRANWETIYGPPTQTMLGMFRYEGNIAISLQHDQIWEIQQAWGGEVRPLEETRIIAKSLLPLDSILMKTYLSETGQIIDLYNSTYLITQFPKGPWLDSNPGDHIIAYLHEPDQQEVKGFLISVGNAP